MGVGGVVRYMTDSERECPDCGGRQIKVNDARTGDPFWLCTDSWCDRRDRMGMVA